MTEIVPLSKETRAKFAVPLWDVLILMAKKGASSGGNTYEDATIFYSAASDMLKAKASDWDWETRQGARQIGQVLDPIQEYCKKKVIKGKNLPRMTGLVVLKNTGKPSFAETENGDGYHGKEETWEQDAQEVCDYPWDEYHPNNPGYQEFFSHAR